MPGEIPIDDAKRIATERRCPVVVIFGLSATGDTFNIATYGMSRKLCKLAASFGEQFAKAITDGIISPPIEEPADEPNYGPQTVCRPLVSNLPDGIPGAVETTCPYCGKPCWRTSMEDRLPADRTWAAACTNCALRRGQHQRQMDRERAEREKPA